MQSKEKSIPISLVPDSGLFERVGGEGFFVTMVDRFYDLVESDLVLRPMYPPDLEPGKAHLATFLSQYWDDPPRYSLERGHPRLRMRHASFYIGEAERDAWMKHMTPAVRSMNLDRKDGDTLIAYFDHVASFLKNSIKPIPPGWYPSGR